LDYLTRNQKEISKFAYAQIQSADTVYVCVSSLWELANHVRDGLIPLTVSFDVFYQNVFNKLSLVLLDTQWKALDYLATFDYQIINKPYQKLVNGTLITGVKKDIHRDPFDRMIIAHAIVMNLPVVSPDTLFPHYQSIGLQTIW
jgi:PIN domain nuclease of toxin-antitoxin system